MFLFIFLIILFLIGSAAIAAACVMKPTSGVYRWPFAVAGAALVLIAPLSIVFGLVLAPIGTSDTGIVTSFGHTDGDLNPGIHWIEPWQDVAIWDGSVQHVVFGGGGKNGLPCLKVRIAGQQQACLNVNIWYQDNRAGADSQFVKYRTFARLQEALFSGGALVQFFNNRFEGFNPVALATRTGQGLQGGQDVTALTREVAADLRSAYAGQVNIIRVTTSSPQYSSTVEAALEQVVKAAAGTEVAQQQEKTAGAQAAAIGTLNHAKANPATITQLCINTTKDIIASGGSLPQAWTCTGSTSGVLVSGKLEEERLPRPACAPRGQSAAQPTPGPNFREPVRRNHVRDTAKRKPYCCQRGRDLPWSHDVLVQHP